MFVCLLQGARGNDGAAGAAGPPVSVLPSKPADILKILGLSVFIKCLSTCQTCLKLFFVCLFDHRVPLAPLDLLDSPVALEPRYTTAQHGFYQSSVTSSI